MKHAGGKALEALGGLLADIRKQGGVVERSPGVFYRKRRKFCIIKQFQYITWGKR